MDEKQVEESLQRLVEAGHIEFRDGGYYTTPIGDAWTAGYEAGVSFARGDGA